METIYDDISNASYAGGNLLQTVADSETFELKLENRFAALETEIDVDINQKLD